MTFDKLKEILSKENINPAEYDILDKGCVAGFDGYTIEHSSSGYELYYMERGQKKLIACFASEHEVCIALLSAFVDSGDPQLQKYIQ